MGLSNSSFDLCVLFLCARNAPPAFRSNFGFEPFVLKSADIRRALAEQCFASELGESPWIVAQQPGVLHAHHPRYCLSNYEYRMEKINPLQGAPAADRAQASSRD